MKKKTCNFASFLESLKGDLYNMIKKDLIEYLPPAVHIIPLGDGLSLLSQASYFTLTDEDKEWILKELEDFGEL